MVCIPWCRTHLIWGWGAVFLAASLTTLSACFITPSSISYRVPPGSSAKVAMPAVVKKTGVNHRSSSKDASKFQLNSSGPLLTLLQRVSYWFAVSDGREYAESIFHAVLSFDKLLLGYKMFLISIYLLIRALEYLCTTHNCRYVAVWRKCQAMIYLRLAHTSDGSDGDLQTRYKRFIFVFFFSTRICIAVTAHQYRTGAGRGSVRLRSVKRSSQRGLLHRINKSQTKSCISKEASDISQETIKKKVRACLALNGYPRCFCPNKANMTLD